MAHAGEGKLVDEIHHPAEPRTHHLHHLQSHLRVRKTKLLKILLANVEQRGFGQGSCRGGIISPVKNRQFRCCACKGCSCLSERGAHKALAQAILCETQGTSTGRAKTGQLSGPGETGACERHETCER